MFKKILILLWTFSCLLGLHAQHGNLVLRIMVPKQKIYIGEPILVKCILVNNGIEQSKVYCAPYEPLLTAGVLEYTLNIPNHTEDFKYRVRRHVLGSQPPDFTLGSSDSIYWYAVLNWYNWNWGTAFKKFDYLHDLTTGEYQLRCVYYLPSENLSKVWQISSNVTRFSTTKMPKQELENFKEAQEFLDQYLGYPGNMNTEVYEKAHSVLPDIIDKDTSITAEYSHYILAYISPLSSRIDVCKSFLQKYANTSLAEEMEFWLARAYIGIGEEEVTRKAFEEAMRRFPGNVRGYYYQYLKHMGIKEE